MHNYENRKETSPCGWFYGIIANMEKIYTKDKLIHIFKELGVREGMCICLQVNAKKIPSILSGSQMVIEALMEIVTKRGCILVPTFDKTSLDPACRADFNYENWDTIRKEMLGYKPNLNPTDSFGEQFLCNEGVKRSKHAIYSFAYWGTYRNAWLESVGDFPVSFEGQLYPMVYGHAMNILIGYKPEDSVLLPALAKEKKAGILTIKRAKIRRDKSYYYKTFMTLKMDEEAKEKCLKECHEKRYKWADGYIYSLWLDARENEKGDKSSKIDLISLLK